MTLEASLEGLENDAGKVLLVSGFPGVCPCLVPQALVLGGEMPTLTVGLGHHPLGKAEFLLQTSVIVHLKKGLSQGSQEETAVRHNTSPESTRQPPRLPSFCNYSTLTAFNQYYLQVREFLWIKVRCKRAAFVLIL